jgi:hypothetical protein
LCTRAHALSSEKRNRPAWLNNPFIINRVWENKEGKPDPYPITELIKVSAYRLLNIPLTSQNNLSTVLINSSAAQCPLEHRLSKSDSVKKNADKDALYRSIFKQNYGESYEFVAGTDPPSIIEVPLEPFGAGVSNRSLLSFL